MTDTFKMLVLWLLAVILIIGESCLLAYLNRVLAMSDATLAEMKLALAAPKPVPPQFPLEKPIPPEPFDLPAPRRTGDIYADAEAASLYSMAMQGHRNLKMAYRAAIIKYNKEREIYEAKFAGYKAKYEAFNYYSENSEKIRRERTFYNILGAVSAALLPCIVFLLAKSARYVNGRSRSEKTWGAPLAMLACAFALLLGTFMHWFMSEKAQGNFLDPNLFRGKIALTCAALFIFSLLLAVFRSYTEKR